MTKHHWRQQIKSLFMSHTHPDKHERLKQSRREMEEKKETIMKLIKADESKTETIEELINDYHKQYESLYEVHLSLTQELNKNLHIKNKPDNSSSSSDSESEDDSESKTSQLEKENAECRSRVVDLRPIEETKAEDSNDETITELQTTIEGLKRDIEMDKDELTTIEEKNRNLEVMLRLSNQKKRVTEQLLIEKEEGYKVVEDRNLALNRSLEEYGGMIREIAKQFNESLGEVESGIREKFDEDYEGVIKSVVRLREEVKSLKDWIKDFKLEREDEKDERIESLGEEKREAIRQLCVWNEYYRTRQLEMGQKMMKNVTSLMH
ncbi:hypothetical protein V2J09_003187 [Rumex salicifolius]